MLEYHIPSERPCNRMSPSSSKGFGFQVYSPYSPRNWKFCHLCIFEHPLATVYIKTTAELICNKPSRTSSFWVENLNQFTFQVSKEKAELEVEVFRKISCWLSRYDTECWIKNFFRGVQSRLFIGDESSHWYQCHGWDHSRTHPYTFMILLKKDLGGIKGPHRGWEHSCHYWYLRSRSICSAVRRRTAQYRDPKNHLARGVSVRLLVVVLRNII